MSRRILGSVVGLAIAAGFVLTQGTEANAGDKPKATPQPASFVVVTEGIVGGFAPAHVRRKILIYENNGSYHVLMLTHASRRAKRAYNSGTLTKKDADALLAQLKKQGLWKLPVESPTGIDDIYKKDTSLAVFTGGKFWRNGGPGGCNRGKSKVQADEEQRASFVKLVATVKKLATKKATGKSEQKTFRTAELMLYAAARKVAKPQQR